MTKRTAIPSVLALLCFAAALAPSRAQAYLATDQYRVGEMEGWKLYISPVLERDHAEISARVLALLAVRLHEVAYAIPAPALVRLREVPIWVEWQDRGVGGMCYHPSKEWLTEHGYNPDKAKAVELAMAVAFLEWGHAQPSMVLHELAHSYHDRVLGFDNKEVKAVYDAAVASHRYESVLHYNGDKVRHYALTNEQEYFAECSEAYFGTNDFYPFVRPELHEFDPAAFHLLEKVWGPAADAK